LAEIDALPERESMEFDVVIVGAGPAGLSAAIRLKQLNPDLSVVLWRRARRSALISCRAPSSTRSASDRLLPDWRSEETPIRTQVTDDRFYFLGPSGSVRLPNFLMPPLMANHGNYIVSLGSLCRWLATKAEALGRGDLPGASPERRSDRH
jgi:electron-transferring-flavoprotein dehydrogenase